MHDKEFYNKGLLVSRLESMPKGYSEGNLMSANDARRIASVITEDFFLIPYVEIPIVIVDSETLTAPVVHAYPAGADLDIYDDSKRWWDNILATVANYKAVNEIQELRVERDKQDKKDQEFAFILFKTADPANLHYDSWNNLSRLEQQRWLNVARKAREELHNVNDLAL